MLPENLPSSLFLSKACVVFINDSYGALEYAKAGNYPVYAIETSYSIINSIRSGNTELPCHIDGLCNQPSDCCSGQCTNQTVPDTTGEFSGVCVPGSVPTNSWVPPQGFSIVYSSDPPVQLANVREYISRLYIGDGDWTWTNDRLTELLQTVNGKLDNSRRCEVQITPVAKVTEQQRVTMANFSFVYYSPRTTRIMGGTAGPHLFVRPPQPVLDPITCTRVSQGCKFTPNEIRSNFSQVLSFLPQELGSFCQEAVRICSNNNLDAYSPLSLNSGVLPTISLATQQQKVKEMNKIIDKVDLGTLDATNNDPLRERSMKELTQKQLGIDGNIFADSAIFTTPTSYGDLPYSNNSVYAGLQPKVNHYPSGVVPPFRDDRQSEHPPSFPMQVDSTPRY